MTSSHAAGGSSIASGRSRFAINQTEFLEDVPGQLLVTRTVGPAGQRGRAILQQLIPELEKEFGFHETEHALLLRFRRLGCPQ